MTAAVRHGGARTLGILLGVVAALLIAAAPASAHAYIVSVAPANGSQIDEAPTEVTVTFSEPVTLAAELATTVLDAAGERVDNGRAELADDRRTLHIGLRDHLPEGRYIASWTVVSADTHPVGGSVQFGYGVPALPVSTPTVEPSVPLALAVALVKGVVYLALILAVGTLPAAALFGVGTATFTRIRSLVRSATAVAVFASAAQVVVQYLWDASALPGGPTLTGALSFASTPYAVAVYARIGLLIVAAIVAPPAPVSRGRLGATVLVGVAALVATVRNGHGGAGPWWHYLSTSAHVAGAVAWIGGLVVLAALLLRDRNGRYLRFLPRWSVYAATAVAVIAVTGLLQSVVQVRYPSALVTTTYGVVLIAKVALVVAAVTLGWFGYRWVSRRVGDLEPTHREDSDAASRDSTRAGTSPVDSGVRRRVGLEASIGALIVVVSGLLSTVAPGTDSYAPTRTLDEQIGPYAVSIDVGPARRGPQTFRITVLGESAETPVPRELRLDLALEDGSVRGLSVDFPYRLPGAISGDATPFTFVSSAVSVPAIGAWSGTLTVVADERRQYTAEFGYRVV